LTAFESRLRLVRVTRLATLFAAALLALAAAAFAQWNGKADLPAVPRFAQPQALTAIPTTPHFAAVISLAAADFTGDGLDDVLVARADWPTPERYQVRLLVNTGHGGLVDRTEQVFTGQIPETVFPYRVVIGDFNRDGVADAFIADTGEDVAPAPGWQSQLILSAPGGHLVDGTPNLPQVNAYTYFADAADVNGDGALDLYLGNTQSLPPQIYLNDGTGHFRALMGALPATIDPPANVTAARFADVNKDGEPDLIVAGADYSAGPNPFRFPPNTFALLNDGHGHFSALPGSLPPKPFASTGEAIDMKTADLNGDGVPDVIISWTKGGTSYYHGRWLQILIANGDGTFRDETAQRLPQVDNLADPMTVLQLVDLNRDGEPDIATSVLPQNPPPYDPPPPFFLNDGHGHFTPLPPGDGADTGESYVFADIDGDGGHDIVFTKDAVHFFVRREEGAPVSTLYGSISNRAILKTADGSTLQGLRAGAYNVVATDQSQRDGFRLVGPRVKLHTTAGFVGRKIWRVQLEPGSTYRYSSLRQPAGTTFHAGR
jgi:FG-GAP-like repeat